MQAGKKIAFVNTKKRTLQLHSELHNIAQNMFHTHTHFK